MARAGSAGLPNKHLLPLLGRPVIQYTFDHARAARKLTHVAVTSDSPDVLRLGAAAGFETVVRPPALATADASVQDVMLHAMEQVESRPGFRADAVVVLYGNVPVRPPGAIDRALKMLCQTHCDSVRSFCPVSKWHPAWMAQLAGDRVMPLQPGSIHRRQDLPSLFLHDGAVVAVSRASMLKGRETPEDPHAFFGEDRRGFPTEVGQTVEIDHLRDLYWAEAVLRSAGEDNIRMAS
ncbi:MAG TPA: acylneuraminate cytidylyltransferase family protein [Tepidisphaeraceae bacterium]